MKTIAAFAIATSFAASFATAASALTTHTTDFLAGYTNYNGFEGMGSTTNYPGATPYTEQAISVQYVGTPGNIWTDSQAAEGSYSWYPSGGSTGYTRITFGGIIDAVEFQASTGWFTTAGALQYDVLLGGVSVGTGEFAFVSNYQTGFNFYGFSGVNFDEVRLQARQSGESGFDASALEALAIDAVNHGGNIGFVPEPATWAMLITGFGLVGSALRRRRAITA